MKQTLSLPSFILLLLSAFSVAGQSSDAVQVVYAFKYLRDLARPQEPYTDNMVLSLSQGSSRYCTQKLYDDQQPRKQEEVQARQKALSAQPVTSTVAGGPMLIVNKHGALINEELMKDMENRRLTIRSRMGFKTYRIDTALPPIDWKILPDKKTIGQYACQQATGQYGGRQWEVWFAPDLPYQDGPWKLTGLPGLILEARDSRDEVSFTFVSIKQEPATGTPLKSFLERASNIATSWKEYIRARTAFEKDPEAVMAAWAPQAKVMVKNTDDPQAAHALTIKQYNPLEHVD